MKQLLLFSTLIVLTGYNLNAQIIWQNTIGGSGLDYMEDAISTSDGGFLLFGESESNSSGDKTENSKGGDSDIWIVKTNSLGVLQWDKTIGGSNSEYALSAVETLDGGFAIISESNSNISGDKTENSKGGNDYWLVKLDSSGTILWDKTIGGSSEEFPQSIVETTTGDLVIGGNSSSSISGDKTENSNGDSDYWVVKTSSTGTIIWDKSFGGSNFDFLTKLKLTSDGGYIVSGTSSSGISGNKTEAIRGSEDCWIIKVSNINTINWQRTLGGSSGTISGAYDIISTSDGGYIIAGESNSGVGGDKTEDTNGGHDLWIIKTNSAGAIQWQNSIGGSDDEYIPFIAEKTGGGYIITAETLSNISGDKTENSNSNDIWLVELDALGNVTGDKTFGSNSTDNPEGIIITNDGNIVIASNVDSLSGDNTETPIGSTDYWLFKVDKNTLSVSSIKDNLSISIYPNPSENYLNIISKTKIEFIDIIDVTGKLISKIEAPKSKINISKLLNGMYILKLHYKQGVSNKRIIKN